MTKKDPREIWGEYEKGRAYKSSILLYDNYRNNECFYVGKQWEGLNAPDLEKPVINILKRVVSYFIAMIVSDDVAVSFSPWDAEGSLVCKVLAREIDKTIERGKLKEANRKAVRNAAIDGDACVHYYYDGAIKAEVVENIDVFFGNSYSGDVQSQPYIIVASYRPLGEAREMAKKYGADPEMITPDGGLDVMGHPQNEDSLVTILTKYWKEEGTVRCQMSTSQITLREEWDTEYTLYPITYWSWEPVKNSCHGAAAITGLIANQVSINRIFAMAIHHIKTMAFPQVVYDTTKAPNGWKASPGGAVGVIGNPNEAIATGLRLPDMSNQVLLTIDVLLDKTMQFMGASDAALGNVRPENTSAIIATQKSTAMPLEIQRIEYYRFVEDGMRIMVDMMKADFGTRKVMVDASYLMEQEDIVALRSVGIEVPAEMQMDFDFSNLGTNMDMNVDIGSSAYWSELTQIQTMDNLFEKGIIADAKLYIEGIPDKYIRNKAKIIEALGAREIQPTAAPPLVEPAQAGL